MLPKLGKNLLIVAIFVAIPFALYAASAGPSLVGTVTVLDGDTIEMRGQRIRLNAIDAPEGGQRCLDKDGKPYRCGRKAAFALADRIGRGTETCRPGGEDRYGRTIATCFKDGVNLTGWMVREGWAVAYRKYGTDYVREENDARANRRGLWSGSFDMPWDWRAAQQ